MKTLVDDSEITDKENEVETVKTETVKEEKKDNTLLIIGIIVIVIIVGFAIYTNINKDENDNRDVSE